MNENYFFLNGNIIPETQTHLSPHDRGLLLGDGVFETLKTDKGKLFFFNQHYQRLKKAADFLSIPLTYDESQLLKICQDLLNTNQLENCSAALRITLTRGPGTRGIQIIQSPAVTIFISAYRYEKNKNFYPRAFITSIQRNPLSPIIQLKTLNYLEPILARKEAQAQGFDEGIMLNTEGFITECSTANIFFIKDKVITTPCLKNGVFPGIIRETVIEICKEKKITLIEKNITPSQALTSEAAFQTNSLIDIQPLSAINHVTLSIDHPFLRMVVAEA